MAKKARSAPANADAPKVYSYSRFSTDIQKKGDSSRRQDDGAKAWAARQNLPLDEQLSDRGLSGFHGVNRKRGALGAFLKRVEAGEVPSGSWLVVEAIDRLSREPFIEAFATISALISHNVKIVTLSPEQVYDKDALNSGAIWQLVGLIQAAHGESERKSQRIRAARDQSEKAARELKRPRTKQCPAWLTVAPDRTKFLVNENAANAIRMIFDLVSNGSSIRRVEALMNENKVWQPPARRVADRVASKSGNGWRTSYIKKLLHNRAVLGEYQPYNNRAGRNGPRVPIGEPIKDYYPQIIETAQWHEVQVRLASNQTKGGKTGRVSNVLRHLMRCAYCQGPMRYVDKGKPPKGGVYLICDTGARGVTQGGTKVCSSTNRIRYDEALDSLLTNCKGLHPADVLPNDDEKAVACKAVKTRVAGLTGELAVEELKVENLSAAIGSLSLKGEAGNAAMEVLLTKLIESQMRAADIGIQIKQAKHELRELETSREHFDGWKLDLQTLIGALPRGTPELRIRMNQHLLQLIDRVEVFANGYATAYDPDAVVAQPAAQNGKAKGNKEQQVDTQPLTGRRRFALYTSDDVVEYAYAMLDAVGEKPTEKFGAFTSWLLARRMSREGRFLRVHYTTGAVTDLVPTGKPASLANGMARTDDGEWTHQRPDIGALWEDYCNTTP